MLYIIEYKLKALIFPSVTVRLRIKSSKICYGDWEEHTLLEVNTCRGVYCYDCQSKERAFVTKCQYRRKL